MTRPNQDSLIIECAFYFKVQYDYAQSLEAAKKLRSQLESAETERRSTESELSAARLGTEKSQNKISNLEAKLSQMVSRYFLGF